jgi:hypothetical protein
VLVLEARPSTIDVSPPLAADRVIVLAVSGPRGRACAGALQLPTLEDGGELPTKLGGLLDVRALDAPHDVDRALSHAKASLWLAKAARAPLLDAARAGGAFFLVVTDLSAASPVSAALHGMLKTAALEWPEVACAVLDVALPAPAVAAEAIAAELRCGFRELEVVRNESGRFVPVVIERPIERVGPAHAGCRIDERSVIVASGGARGVTATTLKALARTTRASLLLLGRTALRDEPACCRGIHDDAGLKRALIDDARRTSAAPEKGAPLPIAAIGALANEVLAVREIRAFLAELEHAGARVMYRAVDVRRVDQVSAACADARDAFGPITGIVHGAGVLADKRIEDKTAEQVDRVMDTKVLGLHALLEATRADPVEVVALFSSVAGRYGNVGQVDYAMANEALNEMAVRLSQDASRPGLLVKSFNWGPWEGGMVTPALKDIFRARGVRVLGHDDGARHFVDELVAGDDAVEVIFGGELAKQAPATTASVHISSRTCPAYGDHAVAGTVVLPVAGALAIMARASGSTSFDDVRVLRGVKLPLFFDGGHAIDARVDGARVSLTERGAKAPSYGALVAQRTESGHSLAPVPGVVADAPSPDPYALLFHGPRFRLVDGVDLMTDDGCAARVHGCIDAGWGHDLAVDVGALDAALQLALLWGRHRTGGAFLPTAIARVDASAPRAGALRAVLRGRSCDERRAVVDVQLVAADGSMVCSLVGVELHRLTDDAAFAPSASTTAAPP